MGKSQVQMAKTLGITVKRYRSIEKGVGTEMFMSTLGLLGLSMVIAPKENVI